jgi:hypothetical protein
VAAELATSLTVTEADRLLQAESLVRGFCGWHIAPSRTVTAGLIRAHGGARLFLPSLYVTAVSDVIVDGSPLTVEDDYVWTSAGIVTRGGCWGYGLVTITYTHGYTTVPAEITAVVQAIAQRAVNYPGGVTTSSSRAIGPFSEGESYGSLANGTAVSLFDSEIEVLRRYRIPVVA